MSKAAFQWDDPLLINSQLSDEERMVRDAAQAPCAAGVGSLPS